MNSHARNVITLGVISVLMLVAVGMWGCPQYKIYEQRMSGQAALAHAESERQVLVREAEARRDAASALAEAEVARARGVAQANQIIGESLQGNEGCLRYLWIQALDEGQQVIYVPTEAGLPILEAGGRVMSRQAPVQ